MKSSLVILVAIISCLADTALCNRTTNDNDNNGGGLQQPWRIQSRTFDGGLTSSFVTALSSLGTIGVLGLILLAILLLPTILSVLSSGFLGIRRGFSDGYQVDKHAILERMSMLHEVWQKFDVKDAQCRKRLVCEVHSVEAELGPSARRIIKFVDYVSSFGSLNLTPLFKNLVQEYVSAARLGKESKDCSSFAKCPYSFAEQVKARGTST